MHGLGFRTSDCTATLIKKFFEPKFPQARTKTEAIIVIALFPYIFNKLLEDIKNVNFVTLTIDTVVCVRYFKQN